MKKSILLIFLSAPLLTLAQIQVTTLTPQFNGSGGLELDDEGNLYIADFGESLDNGVGTEVRRLRTDGTLELFATGLRGASGNDFDSQGNLFQSNIALGTLSKITPQGQVSQFATSGISCNVGVLVDTNDDIFVCNCCGANGNTIRKVSPTGVSTLFSNSGFLRCPNGITQDDNGNIYVSNFGNGAIVKISPTGSGSLLASTPSGSILAASNGHIIYDKNLNVLYVASHATHKIYKLTLSGVLTELAGSGIRGNTDGLANEATFSRPNGLAISSTGDSLYVNSSIPTTNAGGRPLNPSVVRLLTGLNGNSATDELNLSEEMRSINIHPNPIAGQELKILLETNKPRVVQIKILSLDGNLLKSFELQSIQGQQEIILDVDHLSVANYLVCIGWNESTVTKLVSIIK